MNCEKCGGVAEPREMPVYWCDPCSWITLKQNPLIEQEAMRERDRLIKKLTQNLEREEATSSKLGVSVDSLVRENTALESRVGVLKGQSVAIDECDENYEKRIESLSKRRTLEIVVFIILALVIYELFWWLVKEVS